MTIETPTESAPPPRVVRGGHARERILASARELFRAQGINATGIDAIVVHAGAARGSVYYNFSGKTEIVTAYLAAELERWLAEVAAVDDPRAAAEARVAAWFDALAASVDDGSFVGCPFTNAVVEQPSCAPVREIAQRYGAALHEHVAALTGRDATDELVRRIVVLYDGAIMSVKVADEPTPIGVARELALELLRGARDSHPD